MRARESAASKAVLTRLTAQPWFEFVHFDVDLSQTAQEQLKWSKACLTGDCTGF